MKMGTFFAWSVPELRKMTGSQLLNVWSACTDYPRLKIYLHIILLMACCSAIFNLAMWLRGPFIVDMLGLVVGLILPSNIYFYTVMTPRRAVIRQYVLENQDMFGQ